jgi:hypothetical protein
MNSEQIKPCDPAQQARRQQGNTYERGTAT